MISAIQFCTDYEGAIESIISLALRKDIKQSLILGLQTVGGLLVMLVLS